MTVENVEGFVTSTLAGDAYVQVHKRFMRAFEGDATLAVVLSELIGLHALQKSRGMVDDLGQFPFPVRFMEDQLGMSEYKQRNALKRLQAANLLIFVVMGKPATRHVCLNFEAIARLVTEEESARSATKDSKAKFYRGISENAADPEQLDRSLDNIKEPLRGCIHILSSRVTREYGAAEWDPECIGLLKRAISSLNKDDLFDYGRFADALGMVAMERTVVKTIRSLLKVVKKVPERGPASRIYDWRDLV